jgi:iron complex transport system ATP-binding protein
MTTILQTKHLSTGYKTSAISENLNLTLRQGELVCLIGPNGAGKSTLLRTLAGLHPPLSGQVFLAGDNLRGLTRAEIAQRLSLVLTERPDVGLLNGYALVALGRHPHTNWMGRLSNHDSAMISWAIEAVGASDIAHQPLIEMSDGQRQKLMIARALAQDPQLIMLDEPTAYLDLPRRVEVMALLSHLAHHLGQAMLITTHDLDLALRTADTIWLMSSDGSIQVGAPETLVFTGAFEHVFAREGICFDPLTGTFTTHHHTSKSVVLYGTPNTVSYIWTERALVRHHWHVIHHDDATLPTLPTVTINPTEPISWTIEQDSEIKTVDDVDALLNVLAQS